VGAFLRRAVALATSTGEDLHAYRQRSEPQRTDHIKRRQQKKPHAVSAGRTRSTLPMSLLSTALHGSSWACGRKTTARPPESESDHQQSCPCTPRNPPHLAAAAPASLPTQAQLDKIPSVEIEVRPTALPSLLTLTLTPDLDFQSLASEGRDPYAGRTEGHGSVGSKVIVETDGRTRPISLPYLPR